MDTDEAWTNAHLIVINMTVTENSLFNLISEFRNHTRLKTSRKLQTASQSLKFQTSFQPASQTSNQSEAFVISQQDESSSQHYYGTFTIVMISSAFCTPYFLQSSWILNNGSDTHICNKTMLHRFKKTRNAPAGNILVDKRKSNVETFDEVDIIIFGLGGNPWKIIFGNVCYIPNFMTNVAATGKFRAKEMYFDDQRMRMHANGRTFGWVRHVHDHDVLEDNTSVYMSQEEEEDCSINQIRKNANRMIVESIETSHPKEKENSDLFNIASEIFENFSMFLISGKIDFPDILVFVQSSLKSKRKFTSSFSISRDIRFKGDQSERGFKQSKKQGFHATFGAHQNINQNHQNQKTVFISTYWLGHRKKKINHIQVETLSSPFHRNKSASD